MVVRVDAAACALSRYGIIAAVSADMENRGRALRYKERETTYVLGRPPWQLGTTPVHPKESSMDIRQEISHNGTLRARV